MARTSKKPVPVRKKECKVCKQNKPENHFFRTNDEDLFADGRYHTCAQCVKEKVDPEDLPSVHALLAEINRPFLHEQWKKAILSKSNAVTEYVKIVSTDVYSNLQYSDSDVTVVAPVETKQSVKVLHDYDKKNYLVYLTPEMKLKWRKHSSHYTDVDILQLELFCINMKYDYNIDSTAQESMLEELSVLNLQKRHLLNQQNYADYKRVSDAYKDIMKDAGFRPIDKKADDMKSGVDSLGEMIAHIERDGGFIPPNRINYPPDDIDRMLMYYVQWAQRFNNQTVDTTPNINWRSEINDEDIKFEVISNSNEDDEDDIESESDLNDFE